ncbi:tRNA pseudouridine(55) synthase TruB [Gammaproteobacteria bacterium]|nr:tRNA pseudouridine(55) synthase TruB [Gammaproteobacteria bacterium]
MNLQKLTKSGFLLLDKPPNITSHTCLNHIKKRTHLKVGHTGTLDPMATGAMIVVIGDATKFSRWIIQQDKNYAATIQLGSQTDTDDRMGKVVQSNPVQHYDISTIESALNNFLGQIGQVPPQYSAIHIAGKRAYDLARDNIAFEIPTRTVHVDEIKLIHYAPNTGKIMIDITCQSGTYIRSIARDLGIQLGTFAHLDELHRHWISPFKKTPYLLADEITEKDIISLDTVFSHFPRHNISKEQVYDLFHGKTIAVEIQRECAAFYQDKFIGMITPISNTYAKSVKLIAQISID